MDAHNAHCGSITREVARHATGPAVSLPRPFAPGRVASASDAPQGRQFPLAHQAIFGARYEWLNATSRARISDEDVSKRNRCSGISLNRSA